MTDCTRCGGCCRPIATTWTKREFVTRSKYDQAFVREHWRRISRPEGIRRLNERLEDIAGWRYTAAQFPKTRFYECDQYDPVTRLCRAQENKPLICRDFPWYGQTVTEGRYPYGLPRCSFWLDVPEVDRPAYVRLETAAPEEAITCAT